MTRRAFAAFTLAVLGASASVASGPDQAGAATLLSIAYDTLVPGALDTAIISGISPLTGKVALYGTDISGLRSLLFETYAARPAKRIEARFFAAPGLAGLEAVCVDPAGRVSSGKRVFGALSLPEGQFPAGLVVPAFPPPLLSPADRHPAPADGTMADMAAWALDRFMRPRPSPFRIAVLSAFAAIATFAGLAIPRTGTRAGRAILAVLAAVSMAAACLPALVRPASEAWIFELPGEASNGTAIAETEPAVDRGYRVTRIGFRGTRPSGYDFIGIRSPARSAVPAGILSAWRAVLFAVPPAVELLPSGEYALKSGGTFYAWGAR